MLPDSIVKELTKSTTIDFEKDSCSEIRDVATTILHNHNNAATPMDAGTHIMSIEKEKTQGDSEEYGGTHQTKIMSANSTVIMMRKADPCASWERTQRKGWPTKGNSKGEGQFDGACYNCGKNGSQKQ